MKISEHRFSQRMYHRRYYFDGSAIAMTGSSFKVCSKSEVYIDDIPYNDFNIKRYNKFIHLMSHLPLDVQALLHVRKLVFVNSNTFQVHACFDNDINYISQDTMACAHRQFLKLQYIL